MKEKHYLFKEGGTGNSLTVPLSSVVAAAPHFVCRRSQGCRLVHSKILNVNLTQKKGRAVPNGPYGSISTLFRVNLTLRIFRGTKFPRENCEWGMALFY